MDYKVIGGDEDAYMLLQFGNEGNFLKIDGDGKAQIPSWEGVLSQVEDIDINDYFNQFLIFSSDFEVTYIKILGIVPHDPMEPGGPYIPSDETWYSIRVSIKLKGVKVKIDPSINEFVDNDPHFPLEITEKNGQIALDYVGLPEGGIYFYDGVSFKMGEAFDDEKIAEILENDIECNEDKEFLSIVKEKLTKPSEDILNETKRVLISYVLNCEA